LCGDVRKECCDILTKDTCANFPKLDAAYTADGGNIDAAALVGAATTCRKLCGQTQQACLDACTLPGEKK